MSSRMPEDKVQELVMKIIAANSVPASCGDRIDAFRIGVEVAVRAVAGIAEFTPDAEPSDNGWAHTDTSEVTAEI